MLILSTTVLALLAPLPACVSPGGGAGAHGQDSAGCCELYPAASGELVVEVLADSSGPTMDQVALQYAELTGQRLLYNDETASLLQSQRCGLRGSVRVPAEEVQSFFEMLMISNDYHIQSLRQKAPRLLMIESLRTQARNTARGHAIIIPAERLEHFANHPATMVTTVVSMPNTDVRQLSNSMRTMITDANTQQMLPAGNTNSLVLTGFGAQIGALAEMLGRVDLASRVESVELEMISLEHADANKVLGTLLSIVHPPKSGEGDSPSLPASAARIVSDSRTNSLLVSARPKDMAKIKELIAQLDRGE